MTPAELQSALDACVLALPPGYRICRLPDGGLQLQRQVERRIKYGRHMPVWEPAIQPIKDQP